MPLVYFGKEPGGLGRGKVDLEKNLSCAEADTKSNLAQSKVRFEWKIGFVTKLNLVSLCSSDTCLVGFIFCLFLLGERLQKSACLNREIFQLKMF